MDKVTAALGTVKELSSLDEDLRSYLSGLIADASAAKDEETLRESIGPFGSSGVVTEATVFCFFLDLGAVGAGAGASTAAALTWRSSEASAALLEYIDEGC